MTYFLLLCLTLSSAFASREEAERILDTFKGETSLSRRLDLFSALFLGLPYGKGGPLGEGPLGRFDQDPLYRFDTFDCTTYVETILALALGRNLLEFEDHLNKIRYQDGDVHYLKRNHFTDMQWIPYNIENGYLSEFTYKAVPPSFIKMAEAVVSFGGWLKAHKVEQIKVPLASTEEKEDLLQELSRLSTLYSPTLARVPYIPIVTLLKRPLLLENIPTGVVVNFVRPNWDLTEVAGTHQNISHQGFLFREGPTVYLRHASTTGRVENVPFLTYLERFKDHPTLKGIHLMKVND